MKKEQTKLKKVFNIISDVLFIMLIILVICIGIFSALTKGSKVRYIGNTAIVRVLSPSMEPVFKTGDYIIIKKVNPDELKKGDIITFISSDPSLKGNLNTHRIAEVDGEKFITKGDHNENKDHYPVEKSAVVGKYKRNLVVLGGILRFVSTSYGFVLLILIPMLIIIALYVVDFVKAMNQKKLEKAKLSQQELIQSALDEMEKSGELDERLKEISSEKSSLENQPKEISQTEKTEEEPQKSDASDNEKEGQ